MNVQFLHVREYHHSFIPTNTEETVFELNLELSAKGGMTIAMELIKPWLFSELKVGDTIEKLVGISRCSNKDPFNKRIGRELALGRSKNKKLTVVSVNSDLDSSTLIMEDNLGNLFHFRKFSDSERVELISYEGD